MNDTFDNDSENTVSAETYNTPPLNMHNTDPDFHQIKRHKKTRGHFILEFYETRPVNDYRIRNAVTGLWYRDDHPKCKYLVGSEQEDIYFKVRINTGEMEVFSRNKTKNTTSYLLFYDSPEQFERHQRMTLNQALKEKWHEKNRLRIIANQKIIDRTLYDY
jgi:hypothetical protein